MKEIQSSKSRMVFQKKEEKVASNARQSFNQSSNNMGVRIVWCKNGVRIVWVHPSWESHDTIVIDEHFALKNTIGKDFVDGSL